MSDAEDRLERFEERVTAGAVLDPAAVTEAEGLAAEIAAGDVRALVALGGFHWQRFLALPGAEADQALRRALDYFAAVHPRLPEAVPAAAARLVATAGEGPADWVRRAVALLDADDASLAEAITLMRRAVWATRRDSPERCDRLTTLGMALLAVHARFGGDGFVIEALDCCREAVTTAPIDHWMLPSLLGNLGVTLFEKYRITQDSAELQEAINTLSSAWDRAPADYPDKETFVRNLASALAERFELSGAATDLADAIEMAGAAVAHTSTGHRLSPDRAMTLAELVSTRHQEFGDLTDLDRNVELWRRLTGTTSVDDPAHLTYLVELAGALRERHRHTGDVADLDRSIELGRQVLARDPGVPAAGFNLGTALTMRYELSGAIADLDEALELLRDLVTATTADDDRLPSRLSELSAAVHLHFEQTGDPADLDLAISLARRAAEADDSPTRESELGVLLHARFVHRGDPEDLSESVRIARAALDHVSTGERHFFVAQLGRRLLAWAQHTGDHTVLDEGLARLREAAAAAPVPQYVQAVGSALATRHQRTGDAADIEEAIDHLGGAVQAARTAPFLIDFGVALLQRQDADDLAEAMAAFAGAATLPAAAAHDRVQAASLWAELALAIGDRQSADQALTTAVTALPDLANRRFGVGIRQRNLTGFDHLTGMATASALEAGEVSRALTLLETGRGVLVAQALETRGDLSDLERTHPDLARHVSRVRDLLDTAPSDAGSGEDVQMTVSQQRRSLTAEWERLLGEARALPGFERLLLPPTVHELRGIGPHGAVVAVNVAPARCDALIVSQAGLETIPLPGLTAQSAAENARSLLDATATRDWDANDRIKEILRWLWDVIAVPVLDRLRPGGQTRVWWLPTGPLSVLPLHAACEHPRGAGVHDHLVSSYTPTVRALRRAQERSRHRRPRKSLIVALADTPGQRPLAHVGQEAEIVAGHLGAAGPALMDEHATRAAVLAGLAEATWAHFACHAISDADDPMDSRLALHDAPLRVRDLFALRLDATELAYLSACDTAFSRLMPDESIHIASAFQLAGFPHVIGTLWPVADDIACDLASAVYTDIAGYGPAVAVHHATTRIRELYPDNPLLWASHVHFGP